MPAKIIDVPGLGEVKLYKRRGSTSIRLSVSSTGGVRVTMPYWTPYSTGTRFAHSKRDWIAMQLASHSSSELVHRQAVGKQHTLYFVADISTSKPAARVGSEIIKITYPPRMSVEAAEVQEVAAKACIRALRSESESLLPPRLAALAAAHGFSYRSVNVKRLTGRWGSCDSQTNIVLNLFLMQLPWTLIDYVLVHELTHTTVLRHGPDFWNEMARHMPDVKVRRLAMRAYRPLVGHRAGQ